MYKTGYTIILLLVGVLRVEAIDTLRVYFNLGDPLLNIQATHDIDSLLYNEVLATGKKVGIVGYADYLGTEASNITLSENRAKNVADYLQQMGIKNTDIQVVTGKGEISRSAEHAGGYREDRRVDIIPGGFKATAAKAPAKNSSALDLSKLKTNETIRLDNIYFEPGSHKVRDVSVAEMYKLHKIMNDNPTLKIQIEGHICCSGNLSFDAYDYDSEDFNLSKNRARAIYDFLIQKGIGKNRLKYAGFGKTRPLVMPEKTPEDENKNRRVEVRILEK